MNTQVQALGYFVIASPRLAEWSRFASGLLGVAVEEQACGALRLRLDEACQRLIVDPRAAAHTLGWQVADDAALHAQAQHLVACGVPLTALSDDACRLRGIASGVGFEDPAGFRHELFHGLQAGARAPQFGRAVTGFRTGALGLGHAVLHVPAADALRDWYVRVLGARLTDFTREPFGAWFLHFNPRHHSLALIEGGRGGLHHLMIETLSLDDVGQAWDLAQLENGRVATTLGRHTNDFVTSFYARSPDDFLVELGWGGRTIDPQTWQACEMQHGPSLWGHERLWLPEEARARARELRLAAARAGVRQPVQVVEGQYNRGATPAQPWEKPVPTAPN